jgi:hypothetical protein
VIFEEDLLYCFVFFLYKEDAFHIDGSDIHLKYIIGALIMSLNLFITALV